MEEGIEKGREEGKEEGRAEGREEALLSAARKLLEMGLPIQEIAKATGLDEEQVKSLEGSNML